MEKVFLSRKEEIKKYRIIVETDFLNRCCPSVYFRWCFLLDGPYFMQIDYL